MLKSWTIGLVLLGGVVFAQSPQFFEYSATKYRQAISTLRHYDLPATTSPVYKKLFVILDCTSDKELRASMRALKSARVYVGDNYIEMALEGGQRLLITELDYINKEIKVDGQTYDLSGARPSRTLASVKNSVRVALLPFAVQLVGQSYLQ